MNRFTLGLAFALLISAATSAQQHQLPQIYVGEISFEGNTVFSDQELRDSLLLNGRGDLYLEEKLEYDLHMHMLTKYREVGYIMAKVGELGLEPRIETKNGKKAEIYNINVPIEEGDQFRFGHVDLAGVSVFDGNQLLRVLDLQPQDVVNYTKIKAATELLRVIYQNQGYKNLDVVPDVHMRTRAKEVDLQLTVTEGLPETTAGYSQNEAQVDVIEFSWCTCKVSGIERADWTPEGICRGYCPREAGDSRRRFELQKECRSENEALYGQHGFLDAEVSCRITLDEGGRPELHLDVTEGRKYVVENIEIEVEGGKFDIAALREALRINVGEACDVRYAEVSQFSLLKVVDDKYPEVGYMKQVGKYIDLEITKYADSEENPDRGRVELRYVIKLAAE